MNIFPRSFLCVCAVILLNSELISANRIECRPKFKNFVGFPDLCFRFWNEKHTFDDASKLCKLQ